MFDVLILEDEEYTREFFKKMIVGIPQVAKVIDTGNGISAVQLVKKYHPDLILLDIELCGQDLNGLEVAKQIYAFDQEAYMVFVTGYSQYAVDSFSVHPYSYVLKPIIVNDFIELIKEIAEKIECRQQQSEDILVIKFGHDITHIIKNQILFIEKLNGHSLIHTYDGQFKTLKTLDELAQQLDSQFVRVHRSFIVNLQHIKRVTEVYDRSYEIEFNAYPEKAQMSRYQYQKYKKLFQI